MAQTLKKKKSGEWETEHKKGSDKTHYSEWWYPNRSR